MAARVEEWADPLWRLHNLYWITDKTGKASRFVPYEEQLRLLNDLWYLNLILKSRQRGFSTLIQLLALDQSIFNKDFKAGLIAQDLSSAQEIFRTKIKFAYDRLPPGIKEQAAPKTDSKTQLELTNGSMVMVGTSMRSGTLQLLHVSEMGKIAARFPERAREIVSGALNAVHPPDGHIFIESTAEGRDGHFYRLCKEAHDAQLRGDKLTQLDFRLHFFPWWSDPTLVMDPAGVVIAPEFEEYFEKLESQGVKTTPEQRAWYVKKAAQQGEDIKREYPASFEEAFDAAVEGAYYSKQMTLLRKMGRIRRVDWIPSEPVNTFWDLGRNDFNAIWFHQFIAGEHRFINFYQNHGEDLSHYVEWMQRTGYLWGRHYLPHDADNQNLERNESRCDRLEELGLRRTSMVVVPRIEAIQTGIELTRRVLPLCWFDERNCAPGIRCLDNYRKEWDEKLGTWKNHPRHDDASNGADAFRGFGQGWQRPVNPPKNHSRARRHGGMAA